MIARLSNRWVWWLGALLCTVPVCYLGLYGFAWNDYDLEASPAFAALGRGEIVQFLTLAPAYGGSLVLRAPFAWLTAALGGGDLAVFRAVSIPCVLAAVMLAMHLLRRMESRGASRGMRVLVLVLLVCNPITYRALEIGHPEELLCAVFAIGAVLAAVGQRWIIAALLLGLAIATKSWAVVAIAPVLLALDSCRVRALVVAGAVTGVVLAPLVLGAESSTAIVHGGRVTGQIFTPWQIWWPLGESGHFLIASNGLPKAAGARMAPEWLSPISHPLIVLLSPVLSLLWWRVAGRHPRDRGERILGLLALLFLLRCLLDPWNTIYYELPFLLALLCWESLCRPERPPIATLVSIAAVWIAFDVPLLVTPDGQCLTFLLWALPMTAWLAREVLWPPRVRARHDPAPAAGRRALVIAHPQ